MSAGMANTPVRHAGPLALIGEVYRVYGVRGFWHGQVGTFLRETGGGAAWFGSYEYVSGVLRKWSNRGTNSAGEQMMAGATGTIFFFQYMLSLILALTSSDSGRKLQLHILPGRLRQISYANRGYWY